MARQDARLTFDALGRMTRAQDNRYTLTYEYDANGNRKRALSSYYDKNNNLRVIDNWYRYDGMNRIVLSQGVLANGNIQIGTTQGTALAYDAAGNRRQATTYVNGTAVTESYTYDGNNRLTTTAKGGSTTSSRTYDAAGQLLQQVTYSSPGVVSERRTSAYNANGWLTEQNVYNSGNTKTQRTLFTAYDRVGNNTAYQVQVLTGTQYTNYYTTTYAKYDSYKESKVAGTSTCFLAGNTVSSYDVNGNITAVSESFQTSKNRSFVTDQAGHILQKTENGQTQNYFYANEKSLGSSGALSAADFDTNYTPVSAQYPATTPGSYVVSAGDTLRGIALALFGDAQLWYIIADANGLQSDADLQVGQNLTIPNQITNLRNAADTFKPYEPGKIIGDTTPTLPDPPPPKKDGGGCGGVGMIIVAIVAIVATVLTAGALAGAAAQGLGAMWSAGATALGFSTGGTIMAGSFAATAGGFATGLVAGAVGSIVSQGVGIAIGVQDKFSWGAVAVSGLSAGVSASGLGSVVSKAVDGGVAGAMAAAAVSNTITQGVSVAIGLQDHFRWAGVAAAAVGAGVAYGVGRAVNSMMDYDPSKGFNFGKSLVSGSVSGFAGGMTVNALRGGRACATQIAMDGFGNALGNSVVGAMSSNTDSQQETMLEKALRDVVSAKPIDLSKGIQLADTGTVMSDAMNPTEEALVAARKSTFEGIDQTVSENRHPVIDDADKAEAFLKALGQGKSVDDAYATANLVDVKRHVDRLSDLIAANSEDPQRGDWVKTRKVITDALISKDVYFGESIEEILPKGINRMDDSALAKAGTSYTNAKFQNDGGYFGALYENTNTDSGAPTYIFGNRGTESGGAGLRDWLTNFTQAFGFRESQFGQAIKVGVSLYDQLGENLSFTGHSLGGGLAAAQAMATDGRAITFNAEGVSDGTIRRYGLNTDGADQRITALYVNGEVLSRLQDSPVSSAITLGLGTVPKNAFALGGVIGDVFRGEQPNVSSFGLPIVASAQGTRIEMPAVNLTGQQLGAWDRLTDTVSLHFMDYALKSMQTQLQPNGALPSSYLKNISLIWSIYGNSKTLGRSACWVAGGDDKQCRNKSGWPGRARHLCR